MAIQKTFLCLCNTRTGSLVSGCYTLAISLLCMVYYLFRYVGHKLVEDSTEYKGIIYVGFVLYGFMIVSSLVIIPGVQLDKRYLLLPWIYIVILVVLYDTGSVALLTTVHMEREKTLHVWEILWVFFYLFRLTANCYCFTCVVSQYQELSDGRGTYDYFYKPRRRTRLRNGSHFDIDTYDLPFGVHLPPYTEEDGTENNPPSYDKICSQAAESSASANYADVELNHQGHLHEERYVNHQVHLNNDSFINPHSHLNDDIYVMHQGRLNNDNIINPEGYLYDDIYVSNQSGLNDSGYIELNDQIGANDEIRHMEVENSSQIMENSSQRMENLSQRTDNSSQRMENFRQRMENFSQRTENCSQIMEHSSQRMENFSQRMNRFNHANEASNTIADTNTCSNPHHKTNHESQHCRHHRRHHSHGHSYEVTVSIEWI